jgi:toxin ParE1/3/4
MPKAVIPRSQANRDIDDAIAHYLELGADDAALGFIDALEHVLHNIGHHPAAGSPRYAHELGIPDLRSWLAPSYPYLIFYVESSDHVDVWRVLHAQRDIAAWLSAMPRTDRAEDDSEC